MLKRKHHGVVTTGEVGGVPAAKTFEVFGLGVFNSTRLEVFTTQNLIPTASEACN